MKHATGRQRKAKVGTIHKAVILARGLGTRMRRRDEGATLDAQQAAVADTGMKALIPVGRPFLDYVLSGLADAGLTEVCLVIGPEHQAVREYYTGASPPRRVRLAFAIQAKARGTADALLSAEPFVAGEEFVVMNADNYYPVRVLRALGELGEPGVPLFERDALVREGNIPEERIRDYAICEVSGDGYLKRIIEKPDDATLRAFGADALISMNCWRFSPQIFQACRAVRPSPRGELELPRAVDDALTKHGARLKVVRFRAGVLDLSRRADIAVVAEKLRDIRPNP